jgi:hypothetical protein
MLPARFGQLVANDRRARRARAAAQPQVLERINGFFGYPAVIRLHLIQARPQRPGQQPAPAPSPRLTAADESAIAAAVDGIARSAGGAGSARSHPQGPTVRRESLGRRSPTGSVALAG